MLKDVLSKILWHPNYKKDDFEIIILHRGATDNIKRIPLKDVEVERGYIIYYGTYIPFHRILKIKNKKTGEIIYAKSK